MRFTVRTSTGDYGDSTGVRCPRRGCGGEVVYNGNYFCQYRVNRGDPPRDLESHECDWALSHDDATGDPIGRVDRRVWAKLRRTYRPLIEYERRTQPREQE